MAQLHFTLDYAFFVGLMSDSRDEAFGKLMKALLDQVLQAESKEQLGVEQYERSDQRNDYRNGTRERSITTRIGKITLQVPRHRNEPFRTSLFDEYQRNEKALIAVLMEMVVQGVSTRKVARVTEELCGVSFSKSNVSEMCKEMDVALSDFRNRRLDKKYPFVLVDGIYTKVRHDGHVPSRGILWAMGITALPEKYRKVLRTTNILERENKEIRRRERVVSIFPNESSAIRLITAILMDRQQTWLSSQRTFDMQEYLEQREVFKTKMLEQRKAA